MTKKPNSRFSEECYRLLKRVPAGRVTTYGEIARALGSRAYRAVGLAMRNNPDAPRVPCHRVVSSDGDLRGYSGGLPRKVALLKKEGLEIENNKVVDFERKMFRF